LDRLKIPKYFHYPKSQLLTFHELQTIICLRSQKAPSSDPLPSPAACGVPSFFTSVMSAINQLLQSIEHTAIQRAASLEIGPTAAILLQCFTWVSRLGLISRQRQIT
jgi:hypothetical protein